MVETGHIGRQASGSVMVTDGETVSFVSWSVFPYIIVKFGETINLYQFYLSKKKKNLFQLVGQHFLSKVPFHSLTSFIQLRSKSNLFCIWYTAKVPNVHIYINVNFLKLSCSNEAALFPQFIKPTYMPKKEGYM